MPYCTTNGLIFLSSASSSLVPEHRHSKQIVGHADNHHDVRATYAHTKGTAKVTESYPGARIASVVHGGTVMKYSGFVL